VVSAQGVITPTAFIKKWKGVSLNERQAAQEHFLDLCALVDHPSPTTEDPAGEFYAFEKNAPKVGGGRGFADVWKKGFFAWEYKRRGSNLDAALLQLVRYAPALQSPPLHVVSDIERIRIHTAWTNTVPQTFDIHLDDLADPAAREVLRSVFHDPERLKPKLTRAVLTQEAAEKFAEIADRLRGKGTPENVAHFVNQLVFCFFAQSVWLLPEGFLSRVLRRSAQKPERVNDYLDRLFAAMEAGGEVDLTDIARFNGGLFDGRKSLPLADGDVALLVAAGGLDWSQIDPTIFGTLFERFLDPTKRAQIGAHYTDEDKIRKLIEPVILRPLRSEWTVVKHEIESLLLGAQKPALRKTKPLRRMTAREAAEETRSRFTDRLANIRILDPACGSGNFLYLALQGVKDIENSANLECEALGLNPRLPLVGPEILKGIEINPLAAELARTTIWIGDIQWRIRNGIYARPEPILRKLDAIENRDALISVAPLLVHAEHSTPTKHHSKAPILHQAGEAKWPPAEFIVGNPPFLGVRMMRAGLGDAAVEHLFEVYDGRVSREADLVCYWFEKARAALKERQTTRVGLVATNSIRGGANRRVVDHIVSQSRIFEAWSDEDWVSDGAAVRVSLLCFGKGSDVAHLNGEAVSGINPDLTAGSLNLTKARRLNQNLGVAFMGDTKGGPFDVSGTVARAWLAAPVNVNGRPNSDVLKPWVNGFDIVRRPRDMWIVDFGWSTSERDASLYEGPFEYANATIKPARIKAQERGYATAWWRHERPRPEMWSAVRALKRYLVTPTVAKHRLFCWLDKSVCPDHQLIVIARDDDLTFGILQSRFHQLWSLALGTWLGVGNDPRYTPTTTFETFPFPDGLGPDVPTKRAVKDPRGMAIAVAANRLNDLRNTWLNPPNLVRWQPEIIEGYRDRVMAKDAVAARELQKRTLTKLYNQPPQWLLDAHRTLDEAVAEAYGWPTDILDQDALVALLELNLKRSAQSSVQQKRAHRKSSPDVRTEPEFKLAISGGNPKRPAANADDTIREKGNKPKAGGGLRVAASRRRR
jgi:type II restriction/modification system DNA methylase subunit YeeA